MTALGIGFAIAAGVGLCVAIWRMEERARREGRRDSSNGYVADSDCGGGGE